DFLFFNSSPTAQIYTLSLHDALPISLLKEFKLYYYTASQDSAVILADRNSNGIPQNWFVSGDGALTFSKSGKRLFFGLAPIPRRSEEHTSELQSRENLVCRLLAEKKK